VVQGHLHTGLVEEELAPAYRRAVHGAMARLAREAPVGDRGLVEVDDHQASWQVEGDQVLIDGELVQPTGELVGRGTLILEGRLVQGTALPAQARARPRAQADGRLVTSPLPGTVAEVLVAPGDQVDAGAGLVVVEAMKMKNRIAAPAAGTVAEVRAEVGAPVEKGATLVRLEAPDR
jgi:acetyl/propionyl-CoA carboxylase alpha subunit